MLNSVVLVGRLSHDPKLSYTPKAGVAICEFPIAVQKSRNEAIFIAIKVFDKQAENCAQYLLRGSMVGIKGRIDVNSFEDRNGNKRKRYEVIADNVTFLPSGGKKESEEELEKKRQAREEKLDKLREPPQPIAPLEEDDLHVPFDYDGEYDDEDVPF